MEVDADRKIKAKRSVVLIDITKEHITTLHGGSDKYRNGE
jgi:hypothetical protein